MGKKSYYKVDDVVEDVKTQEEGKEEVEQEQSSDLKPGDDGWDPDYRNR